MYMKHYTLINKLIMTPVVDQITEADSSMAITTCRPAASVYKHSTMLEPA